jgi:hypothetical protein
MAEFTPRFVVKYETDTTRGLYFVSSTMIETWCIGE